jgi:DNA repair photolyase
VNPPNPYLRYAAEYIGDPPAAKLEVFEESATRKIITKAFSSDFGFRYTVNCYRGCIHACTYCFARQYHEYLGYGAGTDFETKIVVKVNAPEILRRELRKAREPIGHLDFSFATDPYLPLEATYELTRRCLEVCAQFRLPVAAITKSPLVMRDTDILKKLKCTVFFSIPFFTKEKSNPLEPYTPVPEARFSAMKKLSDEGIATGIAIAPIIPGYNEDDIPPLLEKARECGATRAFMSLVHFDTDSIEEYFVKRLYEKLPAAKAEKIMKQIRRERGGTLRHGSFAERDRGKTEKWAVARRLFDLNFKRLGFHEREIADRTTNSPSGSDPVQGKLF